MLESTENMKDWNDKRASQLSTFDDDRKNSSDDAPPSYEAATQSRSETVAEQTLSASTVNKAKDRKRKCCGSRKTRKRCGD